MIQNHIVEMDGVQLHYAEAPGSCPAPVFIHGTTGSHTSFSPFLPALAQYAHIYTLDLRGHGLPGRTSGAYQLSDYGRDGTAFSQNPRPFPFLFSRGRLQRARRTSFPPHPFPFGPFFAPPPLSTLAASVTYYADLPDSQRFSHLNFVQPAFPVSYPSPPLVTYCPIPDSQNT